MNEFLKKLYDNNVSFNVKTWGNEFPNHISITFSKDIYNTRYLHDMTEPAKVDMTDVLIFYLDKFLKEYWHTED